MRGAPRLCGLFAAGALAACTVGPNYRRPEIPTPSAYLERAPSTTSQSPDLAAWWSRFNDPTLTALVTRALAGNLDVQTAASKLRQARRQEVIAGAAALPQLEASGNVNNTLLSKNAGLSQLEKAFSGGGSAGGSG
ncbi:MAG TPA: TolC family protein, partial [Caulobacteraceae bacterium]|nr:TolC family protein [Caulobacteraceae bacterium]